MQFFLPRYRVELLSSRGGIPKRESLLRILQAFTAVPDVALRVEVVQQLHGLLSTGGAPEPRPRPTGAPPARAPATDASAFLLALSFLASVEPDPPGELMDLFTYHAMLALSMPAPTCRAAAISILGSLASRGFVAPVIKLFDQLGRKIKSAAVEWWEVNAQLAVLCSALLDVLLPPEPTPQGTPRAPGTPPLPREGSAPDLRASPAPPSPGSPQSPLHLTPAQIAEYARQIYRLLPHLLSPQLPIPFKKVALVAFAHRVALQPHHYLAGETSLHSNFLLCYTQVCLLLDTPLVAISGGAPCPVRALYEKSAVFHHR